MAQARKSVYSSFSAHESAFSCFSRQITFHFETELLKQLMEVKFDLEGEILTKI